MLSFIALGGVPGFVTFFFAIVGVIAGALFAFRPDPSRRPTLEALRQVLLTSSGLAFVADLYAVTRAWAAGAGEHRMEILVEGFGESLTPLIIGLAFLSVVWMLTAVGERRLRA